jgi:hypothetical protein
MFALQRRRFTGNLDMMDHILVFADEAAAHAALDSLGFGQTPDRDRSRVIPGLEVSTPDGVLPGFWTAIALAGASDDLKALPNDACRLIADRDAAALGQLFIVFVSPAVDPAVLASAHAEPVFASSNYPFGG